MTDRGSLSTLLSCQTLLQGAVSSVPERTGMKEPRAQLIRDSSLVAPLLLLGQEQDVSYSRKDSSTASFSHVKRPQPCYPPTSLDAHPAKRHRASVQENSASQLTSTEANARELLFPSRENHFDARAAALSLSGTLTEGQDWSQKTQHRHMKAPLPSLAMSSRTSRNIWESSGVESSMLLSSTADDGASLEMYSRLLSAVDDVAVQRQRTAQLEEELALTRDKLQAAQDNCRVAEERASLLRHCLKQCLDYVKKKEVLEGCAESEARDDAQSQCRGSREQDEPVLAGNCVLCLKGKASVLLLPCRHLVLCKGCEPLVVQCPTCAERHNATLHVRDD